MKGFGFGISDSVCIFFLFFLFLLLPLELNWGFFPTVTDLSKFTLDMSPSIFNFYDYFNLVVLKNVFWVVLFVFCTDFVLDGETFLLFSCSRFTAYRKSHSLIITTACFNLPQPNQTILGTTSSYVVSMPVSWCILK